MIEFIGYEDETYINRLTTKPKNEFGLTMVYEFMVLASQMEKYKLFPRFFLVYPIAFLDKNKIKVVQKSIRNI